MEKSPHLGIGLNRITLLFLYFFFTVSYALAANVPAGGLQNAKWIGNCALEMTDEAAMYNEHPAPLFRRDFAVEKIKIKKATLYITAAGYYRASLNGEQIGDIYLDPAWTNYRKRVYFSEYDLTNKLQKGMNCLGVTIGNGFYNPLPLRLWGNLNLRNALDTGIPAFAARLVVEYANGKVTEMTTDDSWKFIPGPILKNNVYLGEWYDGRREIRGWNTAGFDDTSWANVCVTDGPGGKLQSRFFPPVKVTGQIAPVKIELPEQGVYLVDMGTNFAGTYKIRMKGNAGDTVTFRFGERLYENKSLNPMTTVCGQIKGPGIGGPGSPDIAWQTDTYVFGEDAEILYSPEFTFHTFRHMEIKGLRYRPQLSDITGLALNTAVEECNRFECSSNLLNAVQEMSVRTFKSNLLSVQSDCPARERFGYGGDINAVAEAYICNFDMHGFYRKAIYDWVDAINDSVFVDTAPYVGLKYCGISWESAFIFLQDKLYEYYNDREIVRELYALDLKWMEKVARLHPELIINKGLGDHESMIPVPVQITGTCHYLQAARVMKRFAALMGDQDNEKRFAELETNIRTKLLETFWGNPSADPEKVNKQSLYSALLYSGVIPENIKQAAVDSLTAALKAGENGHFTTGIFGTKYILEALSQAGLGQQVFDIVNSPQFPGWGYMISQGATTLWETWRESDNTFSNCHPMFGSVSGWFYRWLGGIRPDDDSPGFKQFYIQPLTPEGLSYVKTSYKTPYGQIVSDWEKKASGEIIYRIKVPKGTTAVFQTEAGENTEVTIRSASRKIINQAFDGEGGDFQKTLGAGEYEITKRSLQELRPAVSLKPIDFGKVRMAGELHQRTMKNFDRLETDIYTPENVFPERHHPTSAGWPGDKEGRTILGLVMEARATHRTPQYLDEMIKLLPEKLNRKGYLGSVQGDTIDEQQLSGHGWLLRGLCEYYLWKEDVKVKTCIEGIIQNLALPTMGHHRNYPITNDKRIAGTGGMAGSSANVVNGWKLSTDVGCDFIFLDGVVQAYALFPSDSLKNLIDEMISRFFEMDLVEINAQTHATLTGLRAVLRYYELSGNGKLLAEVQKRYLLYREQAITENYENFNWFERPEWTEPCAIVDSYLLAVQLWQHTWSARYLEDAQLIYYNALGHVQRENGGFGCDNCPGPADKFLSVKADEAFWCCTMRGGEGLSRAVQYSYFQEGDTIYIPAFHESSASFKLSGGQISITQHTNYPLGTKVTLKVSSPSVKGKPSIRLFIPSWLRGTKVFVNEKPVRVREKNGFLSILSAIKDGDVIEYTFSMNPRTEACANKIHSKPDSQRIFYGPLLLGYDSQPEVSIPQNAEIEQVNGSEFQIKGTDIILSPVCHLMDKKVSQGSGYRKQILFSERKNYPGQSTR